MLICRLYSPMVSHKIVSLFISAVIFLQLLLWDCSHVGGIFSEYEQCIYTCIFSSVFITVVLHHCYLLYSLSSFSFIISHHYTKKSTNTIEHQHLCLALLGHRLVVGGKVQANTVDAVSLVGRCVEAFALENMAEMTAAVGAYNFRTQHAECAIFVSGNSSRDAVKVGGPTASRLELVVGFVEGSLATGAGVDSLGRVVLVKGSGARGLSALFA